MVSSISWHPLDQQYTKNTCGILVIPLLLPQIPRSANMWENVKLNTIPNLKKFGSYLPHLRFREKLKLNGIFHAMCVHLYLWLLHDFCNNPNALCTSGISILHYLDKHIVFAQFIF